MAVAAGINAIWTGTHADASGLSGWDRNTDLDAKYVLGADADEDGGFNEDSASADIGDGKAAELDEKLNSPDNLAYEKTLEHGLDAVRKGEYEAIFILNPLQILILRQ